MFEGPRPGSSSFFFIEACQSNFRPNVTSPFPRSLVHVHRSKFRRLYAFIPLARRICVMALFQLTLGSFSVLLRTSLQVRTPCPQLLSQTHHVKAKVKHRCHRRSCKTPCISDYLPKPKPCLPVTLPILMTCLSASAERVALALSAITHKMSSLELFHVASIFHLPLRAASIANKSAKVSRHGGKTCVSSPVFHQGPKIPSEVPVDIFRHRQCLQLSKQGCLRKLRAGLFISRGSFSLRCLR